MTYRLPVALAAWGIIVACLAAPESACGFFSRGVIDGDLGYSSLEIYKDQEDFWGGTGLYYGRKSRSRKGYRGSGYGFYSQDEYYLNGVLDNLTNRTRRGMRITFYASDCVRERTHWTVTLAIDSLGPHQSIPFREFISYSQPKFPCKFRFHVTEEAAPPEPSAPAAVDTPVPLDPAPAPDQESFAPDNARIYKWVDENGVSHYTNRATPPEGERWAPAWEEE